jgi:hypothetical protein
MRNARISADIERRSFLAAITAPIAASAIAIRAPAEAAVRAPALAAPSIAPKLTCSDQPAMHYFASEVLEEGKAVVESIHSSEEVASKYRRNGCEGLKRRKWCPATTAIRFVVAEAHMPWVHEENGPLHTLDIPAKFDPSDEYRAMEGQAFCDRETAMAEAARLNSERYDEMQAIEDDDDSDGYFFSFHYWSGVIEVGERFPDLIHVSIDSCGIGELGISVMCTARLVLPTSDEIARFARVLEWTT